MSYKYLKNVSSRRYNSKTILRFVEDALCRMGLLAELTCSNSTSTVREIV